MPSFPAATIPGLSDNPAVATAQTRQYQRMTQADIYGDEAQQRKQNLAQGENKLLGQTMEGDAAQWMADPAYRGKSYSKLTQSNPEVAQHFFTAYPNQAGSIPGLLNEQSALASGDPSVGLENLPAGDVASVKQGNATVSVGGGRTLSWQKPSEQLLQEHRAIGGSPVNADGSPKNSAQITQEISDYNTQHGLLPKPLADFQDAITRQYQAHPAYQEHFKMAQALQNFFSNYKEAQANPNLANNMAVIDGFLRTQNPGATVRQQTLNMITQGQGLLQKLTPDYLKGHLTEGQKVTSQFVKEAGDVMKREAEAQNDAFKNSVLQSYKTRMERRGIPSDDLVSPLDPVLQSVNQPAQTQLSPDDQAAMVWAKSNPTDPRAKQIMALHGGR